jgi:pimeloyl-ACP methyl ester carboxylesterase
MNQKPVYVLIHSPLVGGLTWRLVADQMRERGLDGIVPTLNDSPSSGEPYWKQHTQSISKAFTTIPKDIPVILVAHSGAGSLLPAIRHALPNPVHAYVFADAGIPMNDSTRLDLMRSEDPEWASQFQKELERGERFPTWSSDDLREIVPDDDLREQLVAELNPRGLDFFTEPIPVFDGFPDAPCIYIQFSAPYERPAVHAREAGWSTYKLDAGHFHMLVDPEAVTDLIVNSIKNISSWIA